MASHASRRPITVYGAIAADLIIAIVEFIAAVFTGSAAMLAESLHTLVDTGNEALLLLGRHKSRKPADETHPFGHGQELYFWTLIVAMILFAVGGGMSIYEGIARLRHPEPAQSPLPNYVVLTVAFVMEGISLLITLRELHKRRAGKNLWQAVRESKDPAVFAIFFEDTGALIGAVIAAAGVFLAAYFHNPNLDSIASILIGVVLGALALSLASKCKQLLLGVSLEREQIREICDIAASDPGVTRVRPPLTMVLGPEDVLLNLDIQFRENLSSAEVATVVDRLEKKIRSRYPDIKRIFIESELYIGKHTYPSSPFPAGEVAERDGN